MAELGVGYVSIIPSLRGFNSGVAKALDGLDPVAERSGKSMGGRISSGIGTALKGTALGVGAAAGGLIAGGITKGMGRLTAIDAAESKLAGLGHTTQSTATIMDSALASVKGTAYELGDAAGLAAGAVAAGIEPGKELTKYLTMTADAAAIAGTDLSEMGSIINQVQTGQVAYTDNLNQLAGRGVPIYSWLAEEAGVALGEVKKLASEGEISSEMFFAAIEKNIGGAALEMGDSFEGAVDNFGAALGRVGATSLEPFFNLTKDGLGAATGALDSLNDRLGPVAENVSSWLEGTAVPAVKNFAESMQELGQSDAVQDRVARLGDALMGIVDAGVAVAPSLLDIAGSLGKASAALGVATWDVFVSTLDVAGSVAKSLAGPLEVVSDFMADHPGLVTAAVGAWGATKVIPDVIGRINTVVGPAWQGIKTFGEHTGEAARLAQWMNPELSDSAAMFTGLTSQVQRSSQAMGGMRGAVSGVMGLFGGPWGVALGVAAAGISAYVDSQNRAESAHKGYAEAVSESARINDEFRLAVAGTSGALSEQAQALGVEVVKNATASLDAIEEMRRGWFDAFNEVPAPDMSAFTESARAAADELYTGGITGAKSMEGLSKTYERLIDEAGSAYGSLGEYLEGTGRSADDLHQIIASGGPEYEALRDHVAGLSDGGRLVAQEFDRVQAELWAAEDAARRLDPAALQAADGIDVLADSAASGEDKLKALESVMQAMGLAPKNAEEAMMDAAEAVDEIVKAAEGANRPVEELGQNLFDMGGGLSRNNESARDLAEKLGTMREELQNVAINGGDAQGTFSDMQGAVSALAEEFGLTEDEVRALYDSYGILPDVVTTLVNVDAEGVTGDLATIWSQLTPLEEGATIEVEAVADEALAVLDELGIQYELTPDGKNLILTATDDEALDSLQRVTDMAAELGDTEVSPTVLLDTTPLTVSADQAQGVIDALGIQEPTPQAKMIIDELLANGSIAQGDLNFLGAMSLRPVAALNKDLLDNGVSVSKSQLSGLHTTVTKPVVDVNNEPARQGINETKSWLGSIKDRVVNIITNRTERATTGAGGSQRFAEGAVRYAAAGWLSDQQAQVAPGGQWITWAEDETQGESFIPHALSKRRRSTQILAETANLFGMGLVDRGGNPVTRDGTSVAPTSATYFADGGIRTPQEMVDFAWGKSVDGERASRALEGAAYVWGGINWGDCSGAMAALARFATGMAPFAGRFATMNQRQALASMGAQNGLGSGARLAMGWLNGGPGGGHTSGTIHFGNGQSVNVEMGGNRGNGQIGGGAAPASHPQYTDRAHIPLGGLSLEYGEIDSEYDTTPFGKSGSRTGGVASTSVNGVTFKSGKSASWGEASDLFKQAQDYTSRTPYWRATGATAGQDFTNAANYWLSQIPLRDQGGRFADDTLVRNRSGADELVLTNAQWRYNSAIAKALPVAGQEFTKAGYVLQNAADKFAIAVDDADRQVLAGGRGFGGEFLGSAQIVRDAEQGLFETRANIADQASNVTTAERDLADAKRELAAAEVEGGGLTTAQKRKLQDAEENLAKARAEGKPEKIADAEKKLARAREDADEALAKSEDKNAEAVRRAQDRVNKAEDKVMETRIEHVDALRSLEAAERTVIAARYQAAADLATGLGEAFSTGMGHISSLFDEMGRLAGVVDDTRQSVSKLQMQQQTASISQAKAALDLRVASMDLDRVRAEGVISVAEAEWNLQQAREQAAVAGATGIEAMEGAMDRFYRTGKFSVGSLTEEQIQSSREVQVALWGVQVAQKRNALNQFEAARQQEIAQLRVAQVMLEQAKINELLSVQTQLLAQQMAELNGMTQNQATGAAKGFGGLGDLFGGLGKVAAGVLTGLAGFAVGGPLGAIPGGIMAVQGAGDAIRGGIDMWNNRGEMGQAWDGMDLGGKVTIIGGGLAGGLAAVGGGYLGGAEGAVMGSQLGAEIINSTIGSYQYSIESKLDAINRRAEDTLTSIERDYEQREHELNLEGLEKELDYLRERDTLEADLRYAEMMREAVGAPTEALAKAYADAAEQERQRSEAQHTTQMQAMGETNGLLGRIADGEGSPDLRDVVTLLTRLVANTQPAKSGASGVEFQSARIG